MTLEKLDQLEDRIQKPAYLLFVVFVLLFLIIGLVDVIDHYSQEPVLFGRYSFAYFGIVVGFFLVVVAWASLLRRPNDDRWLVGLLNFLQQRPILAVAVLAGIVGLLATMIVPGTRLHSTVIEKPAMQVGFIVILLLSAGLILFYDWGNASKPQAWRRIVAGLLALLLVVELIVQVLAYLGVMPTLTPTDTTNTFAPYNRVYQTDEGFGNGIVNKYGRFVPEFKLLPDSRRIALVGDSFIQGFQIRPEENLGVVLEQLIAKDAQTQQTTEILSLGYPDFGPGMYLSNWMLQVVDSEFEPEAVMVFFDLGSDFQTIDGPAQGRPYFTYIGQGKAQLELDDFWGDLHAYEHQVYHAHERFQLVRLIRSHYLTPRFLLELFREPTVQAEEATPPANSDINLPNGFVFNADTNDGAHLIASSVIRGAREQLDRYGVGTMLVTIPVFTDAFYAQDTWNTQFGDSDLLLPERELREFAADEGIPFLGLGTYMAAQGLTPAEVQELYFNNGRGNFTPAGHAFAAEAVFQCFFAQTLMADAGCDRR